MEGHERNNMEFPLHRRVNMEIRPVNRGSVIFKRMKTGYAEEHGSVSSYPVLSLRKPAGAYQAFLSRFHCVPRVDTAASSAASLTPSGTGLSGRVPLKNRVRTSVVMDFYGVGHVLANRVPGLEATQKTSPVIGHSAAYNSNQFRIDW